MDLAAELARYGPESRRAAMSLADAQDYCRRLAASHYENFTVASRLFPLHLRKHLCHVYAYCRWADDLADEAGDAGRSLELLDWWEGELDAMFAGHASHPVFVALADTVREFDLDRQPLADLLVAFRRDQTQIRYETFAGLLDYCRYSANPVGRIVLALGRDLNDENAKLSDQICTALQLANFCQDVRRDYERGRIYLPQELCCPCGWDEAKFTAGKCNDEFRTLLKGLVDRADAMLLAGQPLSARVGRDLRLPVRVFVAGGRAILAAIRRARYDVWTSRPTVGRLTKLWLLAQASLPGRWSA
jgi:squalene synthase HpnC